VVKHAQASSAKVLARTTDSGLEMEIVDDGRGGAESSGHGITNIVDRVHAMDGEVHIDSPPGHGTRLRIRIPSASSAGTKLGPADQEH
jgi:signal transduction histidine kinase